MTTFPLHTIESAPEGSKAQLQASLEANKRIPNLHATMAEAPGLLEGYRTVGDLFLASSLDSDEKTVVWQAINVEHSCHYCVPAHTAIAKMMRVDDDITQALRDETPLPTPRLEALRTFTLAVTRQRGLVDEDTVQTFLDAGFSRQNALEVVLGLAQKIMSNYTNHLAQTPLDAQFKRYAWDKKS